LCAPEKTEVIVVDGGSTDNTLDILKRENSLSLRWTSEPDLRIYDALNKGAKKASGKWIHFLGADDRLLRDSENLLNNWMILIRCITRTALIILATAKTSSLC
jgi:glycosyltransferase involved in cell wall biosynthesis